MDPKGMQVFMVGTGGQGILLLARALAEIAVKSGQRIIASETHGMAMRGGTVTANLKIGPFASPLIPAGGADLLVGLDETEARNHLHMLKKGGVSIVNAPEKGPFTHAVDATRLALAENMPGAVNMIMLGFVVKILGIDPAEAKQVLSGISPKRSLDSNLKAMEQGYGNTSRKTSRGGTS